MLLGEIGISGYQGICGRFEKHLAAKGLGDAVEGIGHKGKIRGAKAGGSELSEFPAPGVVAVEGVGAVKIRRPGKRFPAAGKVYQFLDRGGKFRAPGAVRADFIYAVTAIGNT